MKNLILILALMLCLPVFAEEQAEQTIKNDQAYATLNLQKQPEKNGKQGITNHFTFFTINVQVNGKLKEVEDVKEN